jgi:hypothetical protein
VAAVERPLNLAWSLRSQISRSVKAYLLRQSAVGCKLTRVVITGLNRVGSVMKRIPHVIVEVIEMIDEAMTDEMRIIRTDLRLLHLCHQFLLSECRTPFHSLSRTACRLLASLSPVSKPKHNNLLHQDIATKPFCPGSVYVHKRPVGQSYLVFGPAIAAFTFSAFVIFCIATVFWRS